MRVGADLNRIRQTWLIDANASDGVTDFQNSALQPGATYTDSETGMTIKPISVSPLAASVEIDGIASTPATSVSYGATSQDVTIHGGDGGASDIKVERPGTDFFGRPAGPYVISEQGTYADGRPIEVVAGSGCYAGQGNTVVCPETANHFVIDAGDRNDEVTVEGTVSVSSTISGGSGNDLMSAGPQRYDRFSGGDGIDTVDYSDRTGKVKASVGDSKPDGVGSEARPHRTTPRT